MLPTGSTPRLGTKGLPSNPRPRSRSSGRSRDDTHSRTSDSYNVEQRPRSSSRPGRQIERSQNTPPIPEPRRPMRTPDSRLQARSTHNSDDSASSATSSLLDRMKLGSGHSSSRTSLEEDSRSSYVTLRPDATAKSLRQRRGETSLQSQDSGEPSGSGDGYAIWGRVATIASTLTVNVSKAWAANITTFTGEETPPGQESRLIRAMKAYHLEKARDPSDLPPWLFDERERRRPVSLYATPSSETSDDQYERPQSVNETPKPRGLREVYDTYRSETPLSRPPQRNFSNETIPPSKATDRLKALRDAKRNAAGSARQMDESAGDSEYDASPKAVAPQPRLGLPSGPRRV